MRPVALVVLGVVVGMPGAVAATVAKRSVAIYPMLPLNTEPSIAERLEELVYQEIAATGRVFVVERDKVANLVVQDRQRGVTCNGAPDCLAAIGKRLGADLVFYGTVATLGGSYVLDAKLVETASRRLVGRRSSTLQGEQSVLIQGVRDLAVQLVAPDLWVGTLEVRVLQVGAEVFVDGLAVGTSPVAPLVKIVPGKHVLRIVSKDFPDLERFVDVRFGATTVIEIDLSRREQLSATMAASAPASQIAASAPATAAPFDVGRVLWPVAVGGIALGAVALGGGVVSGLQLLVPWWDAGQQTRQLASGETVVTDREAYGAAAERYRGALGLWWLGVGLAAGGTAVLAAGGGLLAFLLLQQPAAEVSNE